MGTETKGCNFFLFPHDQNQLSGSDKIDIDNTISIYFLQRMQTREMYKSISSRYAKKKEKTTGKKSNLILIYSFSLQ